MREPCESRQNEQQLSSYVRKPRLRRKIFTDVYGVYIN